MSWHYCADCGRTRRTPEDFSKPDGFCALCRLDREREIRRHDTDKDNINENME